MKSQSIGKKWKMKNQPKVGPRKADVKKQKIYKKKKFEISMKQKKQNLQTPKEQKCHVWLMRIEVGEG